MEYNINNENTTNCLNLNYLHPIHLSNIKYLFHPETILEMIKTRIEELYHYRIEPIIEKSQLYIEFDNIYIDNNIKEYFIRIMLTQVNEYNGVENSLLLIEKIFRLLLDDALDIIQLLKKDNCIMTENYIRIEACFNRDINSIKFNNVLTKNENSLNGIFIYYLNKPVYGISIPDFSWYYNNNNNNTNTHENTEKCKNKLNTGNEGTKNNTNDIIYSSKNKEHIKYSKKTKTSKCVLKKDKNSYSNSLLQYCNKHNHYRRPCSKEKCKFFRNGVSRGKCRFCKRKTEKHEYYINDDINSINENNTNIKDSILYNINNNNINYINKNSVLTKDIIIPNNSNEDNNNDILCKKCKNYKNERDFIGKIKIIKMIGHYKNIERVKYIDKIYKYCSLCREK
jgi:hypothetical protein